LTESSTSGQLGSRAVREIRDAILAWTYKPGEALSEARLAADLGVSRTPVREALRELHREGLVRIVPDRGVFVSQVSLQDIVQIFQMREALETALAAVAAKDEGRTHIFAQLEKELRAAKKIIGAGDTSRYYDLTSRMDKELQAAAGNHRIDAALLLLRRHVLWVRGRGVSKERLLAGADERAAIAGAIARHEVQEARDAVSRHIGQSLQNIMSELMRSDHYVIDSAAPSERSDDHRPLRGPQRRSSPRRRATSTVRAGRALRPRK
jgi:DNA-binding GntR family transcriptional regulator